MLIQLLPKRSLIILSTLLIIIICHACSSDKVKNIPDVSDIAVDLTINRFEQDLFNIDTLDFDQGLAALRKKYPLFSDIFINQLIGLPSKNKDDKINEKYLKGFIEHPGVQKLYDTCMVLYDDFSPFQEKLHNAFQFLNYYFPEIGTVPITTFISEYAYGNIIYGENQLAIGLDFFLGENYHYQTIDPSNPNFSSYLVRTFNADHLVFKTLKPLIEELTGNPGPKLLDQMILHGKQLYIMDQILPYVNDTVIMEYSKQQFEWCQKEELNIWAHFISEDILYTTQMGDVRKYVNYSPNSPNMPPEAPGRTGDWVGWKIVESYMSRFPETTLTELINMDNSQSLLEKSRYRPER